MRKWFGPDQFVPLTILIVAAGLCAITAQMEVPGAFQQISATVWPTTLTITLMICGAIIFVENAVRGKPAEAEEEERLSKGPKGWAFILAVALFVPVVMVFGFVLAAAALTFTVMVLFGGWERPVRLVLTSIILPATIYFLMVHVIGQVLPAGILF